MADLNPPVNAVFNISEAKQRDLQLYNQWKQDGDKESLGKLVKQLHPVIYSQVERVSGTLPKSALSAEAKKWTVKALETYDPSRGVAVSTHVMNYLPKIRRMNYKFQNSARLPENLQLEYSNFTTGVSHLEESLGREPTDKEIAKHLNWSEPLVTRFKGSLYEDLVESASQRPNEVSHFNSNKFLMDHLMAQLDEQERFILLESNDMSAQQAADKLGVSLSRWNYLKSKLKDKLLAIKAEINMY